MNIGQFRKNDKGVLYGHIATAKMDLGRLALRPVQSVNARAPLFEVMAHNPGNRVVRIGALWEATANGTGEVFLQGNVDDPSLPASLPIALFGDGEGGYRVAWRRPRRRPVIEPRTGSAEGDLAEDISDDDIPF